MVSKHTETESVKRSADEAEKIAQSKDVTAAKVVDRGRDDGKIHGRERKSTITRITPEDVRSTAPRLKAVMEGNSASSSSTANRIPNNAEKGSKHCAFVNEATAILESAFKDSQGAEKDMENITARINIMPQFFNNHETTPDKRTRREMKKVVQKQLKKDRKAGLVDANAAAHVTPVKGSLPGSPGGKLPPRNPFHTGAVMMGYSSHGNMMIAGEPYSQSAPWPTAQLMWLQRGMRVCERRQDERIRAIEYMYDRGDHISGMAAISDQSLIDTCCRFEQFGKNLKSVYSEMMNYSFAPSSYAPSSPFTNRDASCARAYNALMTDKQKIAISKLIMNLNRETVQKIGKYTKDQWLKLQRCLMEALYIEELCGWISERQASSVAAFLFLLCERFSLGNLYEATTKSSGKKIDLPKNDKINEEEVPFPDEFIFPVAGRIFKLRPNDPPTNRVAWYGAVKYRRFTEEEKKEYEEHALHRKRSHEREIQAHVDFARSELLKHEVCSWTASCPDYVTRLQELQAVNAINDKLAETYPNGLPPDCIRATRRSDVASGLLRKYMDQKNCLDMGVDEQERLKRGYTVDGQINDANVSQPELHLEPELELEELADASYISSRKRKRDGDDSPSKWDISENVDDPPSEVDGNIISKQTITDPVEVDPSKGQLGSTRGTMDVPHEGPYEDINKPDLNAARVSELVRTMDPVLRTKVMSDVVVAGNECTELLEFMSNYFAGQATDFEARRTILHNNAVEAFENACNLAISSKIDEAVQKQVAKMADAEVTVTITQQDGSSLSKKVVVEQKAMVVGMAEKELPPPPVIHVGPAKQVRPKKQMLRPKYESSDTDSAVNIAPPFTRIGSAFALDQPNSHIMPFILLPKGQLKEAEYGFGWYFGDLGLAYHLPRTIRKTCASSSSSASTLKLKRGTAVHIMFVRHGSYDTVVKIPDKCEHCFSRYDLELPLFNPDDGEVIGFPSSDPLLNPEDDDDDNGDDFPGVVDAPPVAKKKKKRKKKKKNSKREDEEDEDGSRKEFCSPTGSLPQEQSTV